MKQSKISLAEQKIAEADKIIKESKKNRKYLEAYERLLEDALIRKKFGKIPQLGSCGEPYALFIIRKNNKYESLCMKTSGSANELSNYIDEKTNTEIILRMYHHIDTTKLWNHINDKFESNNQLIIHDDYFIRKKKYTELSMICDMEEFYYEYADANELI